MEYQKPEIHMIVLETEDVITASNLDVTPTDPDEGFGF